MMERTLRYGELLRDILESEVKKEKSEGLKLEYFLMIMKDTDYGTFRQEKEFSIGESIEASYCIKLVFEMITQR